MNADAIPADTMLLRSAHPSAWVQDGRISNQVFQPTKSDEGWLSVYNGGKTTAQAAYEHRIAQGRECRGILGVLVDECHAANLIVQDDPLPDNDAHALIGFNGLPSKGAWKRAAAILADKARIRGILYPPALENLA